MKDVFSLKGKNVLITGASSGIGRACAVLASTYGANVVLVGRNSNRLKQTQSKLLKGKHLCFNQDITENEKIEKIVGQTVEKIGKISGFVHSAGMEMTVPLQAMKPSYYNSLFSINAVSGFELVRVISKNKYLNEKGAAFVFISSITSLIGNSSLTGYSASKGAVVSAVRSMAVELAPKNIRVNCISPGYVNTEMMKNVAKKLTKEQMLDIEKKYLLGLGEPEDIASAVVFLLSEASRWISGTNLIIDGGYTAQ